MSKKHAIDLQYEEYRKYISMKRPTSQNRKGEKWRARVGVTSDRIEDHEG